MPRQRKSAHKPEPEPVSPVLPDESLDALDGPGGLPLDDSSGPSLEPAGATLDDGPQGDPDDPLAGVKYTGDVERDAAAELGALQTAFGDRARKERQRFQATVDSEYWFAVCFQSREQKEAFLSALKWIRFGDKYLDGVALAEVLGIRLPPADVPFVESKPDRVLNDLSLELE